MSAALTAALVFTVILLVMTAYVLMGAVPLLTLAHDVAQDSRFVRGFFDTYYRAAALVAAATALSYALAGRLAFAAGATVVALLAFSLRRTLIPKMDSLRAAIQAGESGAIRPFRRLHVFAISVNLAQLVGIVWSVIALSMQMR